MPQNKTHQAGFTLIEVMITVAIIGILAAVALPSYTSYLRRGELPEAFTQLSTFRVQMEQYYLDNRNYGSSDTCGRQADGTSLVVTPTTPNLHFTYSCDLTNSGQGYTLTATGSASRTTGYDYTLNQANAKVTTNFAGTAQSGKNCWLVKGSEC